MIFFVDWHREEKKIDMVRIYLLFSDRKSTVYAAEKFAHAAKKRMNYKQNYLCLLLSHSHSIIYPHNLVMFVYGK